MSRTVQKIRLYASPIFKENEDINPKVNYERQVASPQEKKRHQTMEAILKENQKLKNAGYRYGVFSHSVDMFVNRPF